MLNQRFTPAFTVYVTTLMLACVFVVGCRGEPTGSIHGKVTFEGQSVELGTVAVMSEQSGAVRQAAIESGEYRIDDVPLGTARFTIHTHALAPGMVPPGAKAAELQTLPNHIPPIPTRYQDPTQSGLTLDVQPNEQRFDLELTE